MDLLFVLIINFSFVFIIKYSLLVLRKRKQYTSSQNHLKLE